MGIDSFSNDLPPDLFNEVESAEDSDLSEDLRKEADKPVEEEKKEYQEAELFADAGFEVADEPSDSKEKKESVEVKKESKEKQKRLTEAEKQERELLEREDKEAGQAREKLKTVETTHQQAETLITDREKEKGQPATEKEKVEIRLDVYGKAATRKEDELFQGVAGELSPDESNALNTILDGDTSKFYKETIVPLIQAKANPQQAREELRDSLVIKAKMELEELSGSERVAMEAFIKKLESGDEDTEKLTEKFYERFMDAKQVETYTQSLMLRRLEVIMKLDAESPGNFTDKYGNEWESRYALARAIMAGGYVYEKEGKDRAPTSDNALKVSNLYQLDSLLRDLAKVEDKKAEELNKEYNNASDATVRAVVEEKIEIYDAQIATVNKAIKEVAPNQSLSKEGLKTFAAMTTVESGNLSVAYEMITEGLTEHDGGKTVEGKLQKNGEPIFVTEEEGKPVLYLSEDGQPNGKRIEIQKTDPPARGVNVAQTILILRRVEKKSSVHRHKSISIEKLASVIVDVVGIGPEADLFLDSDNAKDIEAAAYVLLGVNINGFLGENGRIDPLAFKTLFKWFRKEAGGKPLDSIHLQITSKDVLAWKSIYDKKGNSAANVSLEEVRELNKE